MEVQGRGGVGVKARSLVALYLSSLEEHPVLTKALTSSAIAALGDVLSQVVVRYGRSPKPPFTPRSTLAYAGFGFVVSGPLTHYLFQLLEAIVPRQTKLPNLRKVVIDRLFFAPPYLLALFYTVALLEGKSHADAWRQVKSLYLSALLKNWMVWGVSQYINIRFVPLKYRVLFANMVALLWNVYIALLRRAGQRSS